MEGLNSGSSGDQIPADRPKRRRPRTVKSSNLSERLDPNFDPKGAVSENFWAAKSNYEEKVDPVELDPYINPTFIQNYLPKILLFLQSNQKELYFPNLPPAEENFLVMIAENNNVLKSCNLCDEGSLKTAEQILEAVEQHKDVYKWIHTYLYIDSYTEGWQMKKVLTYKKLKVTEMQKNQDTVISSKDQTPSSLASGLQKMTITQDGQATLPSFKTGIINTTLKFIKDPTQLILKYPELPKSQAEYFHNVILPGNRKDGDLGFGFKSMYSSLHNTIKRLKDKYEFKFSFQSTSDPSTTRLILNKIPKMPELGRKGHDSNNNSKDLNSSISSSTSNESNQLPGAQKLQSKKKLVDNLPESFLRSTMENILEFIDDNAMASLEFKNVNVTESKFLERLLSLSKSEENHKLFSSETGALLKRVSRAVKRRDWNLRLSVGKLSRATERRTIVFYKTPSFDSTTETNRLMKKIIESSNNVKPFKNFEITCRNDEDRLVKLKDNSPTDNIPVDKKISEKSNEGIRKSDSKENPDSMGQRNINQNVKPASNASTRQNRSKPGISFLTAGSLATEAGDPGKGAEARGASPPPASRKGRLLKALTKPIESGRAERMMRMMGWEGGALGLRGEGITEPILPAIHISPGAGLGHIKQTNRSLAEFKLTFLRNLDQFLISSSADETTTSFGQPLTKRECRFVNKAVEVFNERNTIVNLGLSGQEELDFAAKIMQEMTCNIRLRILFQISDDKTQIHLSKSIGPIFVRKPSKKKKKSKPKPTNDTNSDVTMNNDVITVTDTINVIEDLCPTRKAAQNLAYKIKYLEKIKEFLSSENDSAEYNFDWIINMKQRNYIQNVITDVNKGVSTIRFSEIENDLVREIRKSAKGCYVSVTFNEQKLKLHKCLPRVQYTNSSLPPPKSKDLKNTVIYQNNVVIRAEEYNDYIKNIANCSDKKDITNGSDKKDLINGSDKKDITNGSDKKTDDHDIGERDQEMDKKGKDRNIDHDTKICCDENIICDDDSEFRRENKELISKNDNFISNVPRYAIFHAENNAFNKDIHSISDNKEVITKSSTAKSKAPNNNISYDENNVYDNDVDFIIDNKEVTSKIVNETSINISHENCDICGNSSIDEDTRLIINNTKIFSQSEDTASNDNTQESDVSIEIDMNESGDSSFLDTSNNSLKLEVLERETNRLSSKFRLIDDENCDTYEKVNNNNDAKDRSDVILGKECYTTGKHIDTKSNSNKRSSITECDHPTPKKSKFLKYISIVPKDRTDISVDAVKLVQKTMAEVIDEKHFLPLLKCHGIKDGGLVYSCHSEDSFDWLQIVLATVSGVEMIDTDLSEETFKLSLKINSFIEEDACKVFDRLTMYNPDLSTEHWMVFFKYICEGYVKYNIFVDEKSFKYVSENGFSLFAGIDKVQFSVLFG